MSGAIFISDDLILLFAVGMQPGVHRGDLGRWEVRGAASTGGLPSVSPAWTSD